MKELHAVKCRFFDRQFDERIRNQFVLQQLSEKMKEDIYQESNNLTLDNALNCENCCDKRTPLRKCHHQHRLPVVTSCILTSIHIIDLNIYMNVCIMYVCM